MHDRRDQTDHAGLSHSSFVWFTDDERGNLDTHSDGPGISRHGDGKDPDSRVEGHLTAAFTGRPTVRSRIATGLDPASLVR
jgi:hypothetical protein